MINENEMGQDSMMPENAAVLSDFDLTEQTLLEYGDVLEDLEPLTFSTLTLSPFCCGVDTFENIYTNINGYAEVVEPWLDLGITSYISKVTVAWIQDWYVFKIEVTYTGVETGQEITLTAKSGDKSDLRETRGGTYFTNTLFLEEGEYISQVLIEGFGVMSYIELKTNTGKVLEGGVRVDVLTTSLELLVQNSAVVAFSINVGPEEWILGLEVYYVNLEDAPLEYVPPPVPEYLTIIEYPEQTLLPDEVELTPMCRGPLYYEEAPYHIEDEFVEIVDQWYEEELDPVIKEIHIYIVAELFVYQMDVHYQNSLGEEYIIIHKGAEQEKVSPNREYLISSVYLEDGEYIISFIVDIKGVLNSFQITTNYGEYYDYGNPSDLLTTCELLQEEEERMVLAFQFEIGPEEWLHGIALYTIPQLSLDTNNS